MSFLFSNDRAGEYPESYYAASTGLPEACEPLRGEVTADVAIIGAGFTGLSTALHLAQAGFDVAVLDAHRAGFGASGRNGGQVGTGYNLDQIELEKRFSTDAAHQLWEMSEAAKRLVHDLCNEHSPDAGIKPGVAHADFTGQDREDNHRYAEHLAREYDYDRNELFDGQTIRDLIKSDRYAGGVLDHGAWHLHPLRYALGLSRAAQAAGARLYENSHVHHVKKGAPHILRTGQGQLRAKWVVFATNGYHGSLNRHQAARVMPINNYLVATAPLPDLDAVMTRDIAVADNRFVLNYYRFSDDRRLIFGGGESYGTKFPRDIFAKVRKPLAEIFPQLANVELTHAWGGTLGISAKRVPLFARVGPNMLTASGYSGHGVALASFAGKILSETIQGQESRFDLLSQLPTPAFPGGQLLRGPIMTLAMTWFSLRDKLGI